jgi:hypothetical protein
VTSRGERARQLWPWLVGFGLVLQVIGISMVHHALTARHQHHATSTFIGGLVLICVGIAVMVGGAVAAAVALSLEDRPATTRRETRPRGTRPPEPPQRDPADVPRDPQPFRPHDDDSVAVAAVRRALLAGKSTNAARRAGEAAATGADQAMIEALIAERQRRPLGPVPTDV